MQQWRTYWCGYFRSRWWNFLFTWAASWHTTASLIWTECICIDIVAEESKKSAHTFSLAFIKHLTLTIILRIFYRFFGRFRVFSGWICFRFWRLCMMMLSLNDLKKSKYIFKHKFVFSPFQMFFEASPEFLNWNFVFQWVHADQDYPNTNPSLHNISFHFCKGVESSNTLHNNQLSDQQHKHLDIRHPFYYLQLQLSMLLLSLFAE